MPENKVQIILEAADKTKAAFDELERSHRQTTNSTNALKESWVGATVKIAAFGAAIYGAKRTIYDTAKEIASAANNIERQSAVLGISTDMLQKWQFAAKMTDVNAQELAIGFKLLSRNMEDAASGSGEASKYFSAMGVSVKTAEGHLRPLNQIMGDVMDKFAAWEDGPRKIAIALQLFGRSGESLIPLLNKGSAGFAELAKEAENLGIILDSRLIKRGSEMEDTVKKWELRYQGWKMQILGVIDALDQFGRVKVRMPEGLSLWEQFKWGFKTEQEKLSLTLPSYEPGPYYPKTPPPSPPIDQDKIFDELLKKNQRYLEQCENIAAAERNIVSEAEAFLEVTKLRAIEEDKVYEAFIKEAAAAMELDEAAHQNKEIAENLEKQRLQLIEIQNLIQITGWEDYAAGADAASEATRKLSQMAIESTNWAARARETARTMEDIGSGIANVWTSSFSQMRRSGETFKEWFSKLWLDMADYAVGQIARIAANYALFQNLKGTYESGKGILGWAASLLKIGTTGSMLPGSLLSPYQYGGIVTRPTQALIGEAGPEAVIPLKEGKVPVQGGDTYIIQNTYQVYDPNTFMRIYGPVIKKASEESIIEAKRFGKPSSR
jgi:hypothetical protein